ncbi:iron-containing alcohol dehydrogenase [Methanocalculus sp.]|uniref:iron-containing alcohol dehydrogenase n=1 Tax=Methanocalculus sp. TaxID=2004547 RepID=UPI00271793A0|nr:iron-containing alcohol dehydrogenase [Methanocalculus sp.]MDO8841570.1 iron-containing alcohol dehydrogenase [Methanocalculus sp.]
MSSLTLRKFVMPEVVFGEGARRQAVQYLDNLGVNHALLVTDPGVIASGWIAEIAAASEAEGIAVSIFSKISENPRTNEVESGAQVYRRNDCNGILAIGGGSSMDCAKGIAILSTNGGEIRNYEGVDQIPHMGPPLICIPTTAGSSADISQFAVITDRNKKKKFGIISKTIIPDVSLVDPDMLSTLPRSYIAYCGFDALTHAIEAYVSTGSSHLTDLHALEAIRLIKDALPRVYKNKDDAEGTRFMALGSLHAGIAFSNASLGLVHAMAHPLSGVYDLLHGEMNSLLLPHIIRYNFESSRSRYEQIAMTLGVPEDEISREGVEALINVLGEIAEDVGITGTLSDRGVMKRDIPTLADFAVVDGCIVTNPRLPTWEEVTQIYEKAL